MANPGVLKILLLILGGSAGTLARYALSLKVSQALGTYWPYGTFCVNMLGALAMGILLAVTEETTWLSPETRLLLGTGFLGALTTFSAFELEAFMLVREGVLLRVVLYLGGSVVIGFGALALGFFLTRTLLQGGLHRLP